MAKTNSPYDLPDVAPGRDPGARLPESVYADAYGHDIATAGARFGSTGIKLAEDLAADRQKQEDAIFHSTATTKLRTRVLDMERALKQEVGTGAPNYSKLYAERYKKLSDEVREETAKELAGSKDAKSHYDMRAAELGATYISHAAVYEDQERKRLYFDKLQGNINEIGIAAYKGTMSREDALRQVGTVLADGSTSLLPDERRDAEEKAKRIVSTSYLNGIAERDPNAALGIIKKTGAKELASWGLQPGDIDRVDNKARSELKRRASEARMAQAIERATLREDAAGMIQQFLKGYEIEPAKMTDTSLRLRQMGDEKLANRLDLVEEVGTEMKTLRRGSISDFATYVNEAKAAAVKNPSDEKLSLKAELAEGLLKQHVTEMRSDPLPYAARLFPEIGEIPPVDVSTPDAARESMKARVKASDYATTRLGIYVPPLALNEAAGLKGRLDSLPPDQHTAIVGQIDQALGRNNTQFWAMLADGSPDKRSAEAGRTASLAELARTNPGVATDILLGREALKADKNYGPADTISARTYINGLIGNAFNQMPPAAREAFEGELSALYARESFRTGDKSGQFNETRMRAALQRRVGGELITQNDGTKIFPPVISRDVKAKGSYGEGWDLSRWRDYVRSLQPSDLGLGLKPDGKTMALPILPSAKREVSPELMARNGIYENIGAGRYIVRIEGEYLIDPRNGRKFVFDHRHVGEGIQERK